VNNSHIFSLSQEKERGCHMDDIRINGSNMKLKESQPGSSLSSHKKPDIYEIHNQKKKQQQTEEDVKHISAKLHPEYDQDLKEMIKKIPRRERSKFYRDAVRSFLESQGIK
jgi:hypothetical protein